MGAKALLIGQERRWNGIIVQNELSRFKFVTNFLFSILVLCKVIHLITFLNVSAQREGVMENTCGRLMVKSQRGLGHVKQERT